MDKTTAELIVGTLTSMISERLAEATSLAKAAEACARANNLEGAVQIVLGVDQPIYEVQTLMNATTLLHRLSRDD